MCSRGFRCARTSQHWKIVLLACSAALWTPHHHHHPYPHDSMLLCGIAKCSAPIESLSKTVVSTFSKQTHTSPHPCDYDCPFPIGGDRRVKEGLERPRGA